MGCWPNIYVPKFDRKFTTDQAIPHSQNTPQTKIDIDKVANQNRIHMLYALQTLTFKRGIK